MPPSLFSTLLTLLETLPGVGPKTAERFAFYLLKQPKIELDKFISLLEEIKQNVKQCRLCQNFSLSDPCEICADRRRDQNLICVVAEAADQLAIEKTREYAGLYHILSGVISAPEGQTPDKLKIKELLTRVKNFKPEPPARQLEIILGLNATIEGETTSLYLTRLLKPYRVKITRLARGLPQGSDLQYADEITLLNALKGRRDV